MMEDEEDNSGNNLGDPSKYDYRFLDGWDVDKWDGYKNSVGNSSKYDYRGLNALRHPLEALKERMNLGFLKKKKKKTSFVKRVWNGLPLTAKIVITIAVVSLVLIIVILLSIGDNTSKKAVTTRSKGVSKLNITEQSPKASQFALELYEKYDSLIGFTTSDLNTLYEEFQKDTSNQNKYLLSSGKKKFGSSTGEKYTIDQELSLYQHIQRTEKYNFNKIRWREYTHSSDDQPIDTELNEELELHLPKGIDEETRETLLKTTSPYILTQDIPLGFLSGMVAQSGGVSSTSSNTSEKFVYQILKEALSKITVNKYVLQSIKLNSSYQDCDYNEYEVTYYVNTWDNGYEEYVSEDDPVFIKTVRHETTEEKKIDNTEQYNSETYWYVADAFTYDRVIKNNFNYTKYSEADVQSLNNPDNNTLINTITIDEKSEDVEQKKVNEGGKTKPTDDDGNSLPPDSSNVKRKYSYIQKQGNEYVYEKEWKDKLSAGSTENKEYSYDTAKEFNTKNDEIYTNMPTDKSLMAEDKFNEKFPSGKSIFDTFAKENTSLKLYGMSIVDLMDTNSGIYSKYLLRSSSNSNLEGISREKLKPAYNQVKNILNSLITKANSEGEVEMNFNSYTTGYATDGSLPFVYGSSLGYSGVNMSMATNSSYISASNLLKEYLRSWEGIGFETDPESTKIKEEGENKYYKVASNGTVGHGVDINVNPQWKAELEEQLGTTIVFGETYIPCELVDAIEDRFMNEQLSKVEEKYPDLKTYQKHALVVRMYNWPDISGFANYYPSMYNESTDDRYESVYEQYKDKPTLTSEIKSKATEDSILYKEYLSTPDHGSGYSLKSRRFAEWCLFSLGYYDRLQKFYTEGGSTPVGDLVDSSGNINQDKVNELQLWYEDNIFSGAFHGGSNGGDFKLDSNCKWYSAKTEEYAKKVKPSQNGIVGGEYFDYDHTIEDHKAVGKYFNLGMFQCTWWSNCRQAQYLTEMGYQGEIKFSLGDGRTTAEGFASAYNLPLNTDFHAIRPHSVASEGSGGTGHTFFVEAVGKNSQGHNCIVISHCGSGHAWHGVDVIDTDVKNGVFYTFTGSVCLDDLL